MNNPSQVGKKSSVLTPFHMSGIFNTSDAEILSYGSDPVGETGLLIFSESKIKAQYHAVDADCYSKTSPLSTTEWTRFTFMLKKNFHTRIFLDNVKVSQHEHPPYSFPLNSAKVINLASSLSSNSFPSWTVENIQLSDLSLWIDIPGGGGWDTWAGVTLPETLGNDLFLLIASFGNPS